MTHEVVTVGETMVLVTPTTPQPLETATEFSLEIAGAESNFALFIAELGHPTAWASRLGDDPLGRRIRSFLDGNGVDTSLVEVDADAPTGLFVKDPGTGSTRVYYYRRGSAASRMSPAFAAGLPIADARLVHLSGVTAGLSPDCAGLVDAVIGAAHTAGTLLSFDVNYRPGVWTVEQAAEPLRRLADRADVVLVGLDEAATLWGMSTPEDVRAFLPVPERLVVKDGAVGATEFLGAEATFVPTPPVEVVEVVGAGDAFAAGYLSGVLKGRTSAESLACGHALAARALTTTGDFVPSAAQPLNESRSI